MNMPKRDHDRLQQLQRIGRWWSLVHAVAMLLVVPLTVGLVGYGLAHGSSESNANFFAVLLAAAAVMIALPLAFWLRGRGPLVLLAQALGALVLLLGAYISVRLLIYVIVEPAWAAHRFETTMAALRVEATRDEAIVVDGQTIGVRVEMDVVLPHAVPLDRYGRAVANLLQTMGVERDDRAASEPSPFSRWSRSAIAMLDGRPITDLPGVVDYRSWREPARPGQLLPAGKYRITRSFWLEGLQGDDKDSLPCRIDRDLASDGLQKLAGNDGQALHTTLGAQFDLGDRRGNRYFRLNSPPLTFRYIHNVWMRELPTLALESCNVRAQRREQAQRDAAVAKAKQSFAAGDPSLSDDANPLYQAICAHDLDALGSFLAAGPLRYNIAGKLWECGAMDEDVALFRLLLPALRAREEERAGYCTLIESVHSRRDLTRLQILVDLGLPLSCDDPTIWRRGLAPVDRTGTLIQPPSPQQRSDTVPWLRLLAANGVAVCASDHNGTNLLSEVVDSYPADVLLTLLDLGCDPKTANVPDPHNPLDDVAWHSAQLRWRVRRHAERSVWAEPIDAKLVGAIDHLFGDPNAEAINRSGGYDGATFLHHFAAQILRDPELLSYLVEHGARLDVADNNGLSWFRPGYHATRNEEFIEAAALDRLSEAKLRELIAPVIVSTGQPGRPMTQIDNPSANSFGAYLCRRGVRNCAGAVSKSAVH